MLHRPQLTGARRSPGLLMMLLLVGALSVAACGGKSEAQQASEALARGLAAHQAGNLDAAANEYRECLKHDSRNKFCYFNLGVIAQAQNNAAEAENNYRIALSIDPEFPSAIWNLAILRAGLGGTAEAIELWRHFLRNDPNAAGAHWNLAVLLRNSGNQAEGDQEMATAIALDPTLIDPVGSGTGASPRPSAGGSPTAPPATTPTRPSPAATETPTSSP